MQGALDKLAGAVEQLYARDAFLFAKDLGERTLTHRVAVHLEHQFPDWSVDCDYNRLGDRTWLLPKASIVSTDDDLGKSIYPDIVVHRREVPDNMLAVEVRKARNHQPLEHDRHKLRALTDPHLWFAYRIGVCLMLGKSGVTASEVFVGGGADSALSEWFSRRLKLD
ncbi:MAG: hypothetical protein HXX15_22050 [Rhodopseudomonas sp.]|uniref:hypothetical protein n=1 Tax=Rhodopseudomonas sp. TaxID=1078 RepID=UPI001791361F|nr:hypothetical protein [Rhodopseudomonas sp.]NVN88767.1 hypothetical protein [Rhodopseudomonas sp.]